MKVARPVWLPLCLGVSALAGCIPQGDPPPRYQVGRPAADWRYRDGRRQVPARPEPTGDDEVAAANRRSLDEEQAGVGDRRTTAPADPDEERSAATAPIGRDPPSRHVAAPSPESSRPDVAVDPDAPPPPRARPAWEARQVAADAVQIADGSYVIRPGQNLRDAGEATGVGAEALARANDLSPPFDVRPGQRLRVPSGRYHLVRPGQAGIAIARAYGVEWSRIVDANHLAEPYTLHVGQHVLIPGDGGRTASASDRAAAFSLDVDDILTGGEPALAVNQAPARPIATATRVLPPSAAITAPVQLRGGFAWPVDGKLVKRFGHGQSGIRNDGIEIAIPVETAIHASADGVVAYAGDGISALGGLVIVRHGDAWTTVYGHASKLLVQRGQSVKRGETIALSGDSGFADRPELHFELRKGRTPVDPLTQLPGL